MSNTTTRANAHTNFFPPAPVRGRAPSQPKRWLTAIAIGALALSPVVVGADRAVASGDPACGPLAGGVHQVSTVAQLEAVGRAGAGTGNCQLGAPYTQTMSLTLPAPVGGATSNWTPIGSGDRFTGFFNGNGHTITGLTINDTALDNQGMFAMTSSTATLANIGLVNVSVTGKDHVGGLVGRNYGGTIANSYATRDVTGNAVTGAGDGVGGLVGSNEGGTITNSYATGDGVGATNVGGLVGRNEVGTITNSYATGDVTATNQNAGGLAGRSTLGATITNSYAAGAVTGGKHLGGLVGYTDRTTITNSYATGAVTGGKHLGGLVGLSHGVTVTDSFWDKQTTSQSSSVGSAADAGKDTLKMKDIATFTTVATGLTTPWKMVTTWEAFSSPEKIWGICEAGSEIRFNDGYPYLLWQASSDPCLAGAVVPSAPALSSATSGVGALTVTFTQGSTGGLALTNYEYSTDGGATFRALAIPDTTSPVTISTLSSDGSTALGNGTTYVIQLRAVNFLGNSTASGSLSATTSAIAPGAPVITAVSLADKRVSVTFTSGSNGGSTLTNYRYSTDGGSTFFSFSPAQTTSPLVITALSTNGTTVLANGTAYPLQIRAENAVGFSVASNTVSGTPVAPAAARTPAPAVTPPTPEASTTVRVAPRSAPTPAALTGPVLRGNVPPVASATPWATVNGRPTVVTSTMTGFSGVSLRAGSLTVGMTVPQNQGGVTRQGTSTQVNVQQGASTPLRGSGVLPGSTVQVFLPLQGGNAKEIGRIASDSTGSFSGTALFATGLAEAPMPIGRQVLQVVSVAPNGQQTVVEMTINIGQSAPAPESNRQTQQLPALTPGASLATEAGIPVSVRVNALEEQKQVTVEGDGWSMAVDLTGEGGTVRAVEGGATMELVRDETALVSGSGFMPGSRADVWLFSTPTLLGTVTIDAEGNFVGEINVDPNAVAVGEHTLQLQGVGQDGYVRAANVGVVVSDPVTEVAVSTDEVAGTFLWWLWLLIALLVTATVIAGIRYSRRARA